MPYIVTDIIVSELIFFQVLILSNMTLAHEAVKILQKKISKNALKQ